MNGLQQLPTIRHITGAVQVPLVMLVWGALVLFFGHQYQANALLPNSDRFLDRVPVEAAALLRAQQRDERLLAQLAAQAPTQVPSLLDPHSFGLDLAAELSSSELGQGEWQPGSNPVVVEVQEPPAAQRAQPVQEMSVQTQPLQSIAKVKTKTESKTKTKTKATIAVSPATEAGTHQTASAKFVRLPAAKLTSAKVQVDSLRTTKDQARADILAGRTGVAYQRLRGQVATGRSDIEFLGLLALASLQHRPDEAEILYQYLIQLQPDAQQWEQGLVESQRLLAARVVEAGPELAGSNRATSPTPVTG